MNRPKLNIAIIGQGRSGKNIHGKYYISDDNRYYNVKYVVDADHRRRNISLERYKGCEVFSDYRDLLDKKDIDLVVNASYSEMHFDITKNLIENGFNVLVEKPFARNRFECQTLINKAKKNDVLLAVFHNTQYAPFYKECLRLINQAKFGKIEQISIRYNSFARRWDWQTLQKRLGGSAYNTGPHPICMALGFLDFDSNLQIPYTRLASSTLTSGDAEDYVKILLTAPNKPLIDIEISSLDTYSNYMIKVQGSRGTFKSNDKSFEYKYIIEGENIQRTPQEDFLQDDEGNPIYCGEKLKIYEEKGSYTGDAFDIGTAAIYQEIYNAISNGAELTLTPQMATEVVGVIERLHAENALDVKF